MGILDYILALFATVEAHGNPEQDVLFLIILFKTTFSDNYSSIFQLFSKAAHNMVAHWLSHPLSYYIGSRTLVIKFEKLYHKVRKLENVHFRKTYCYAWMLSFTQCNFYCINPNLPDIRIPNRIIKSPKIEKIDFTKLSILLPLNTKSLNFSTALILIYQARTSSCSCRK